MDILFSKEKKTVKYSLHLVRHEIWKKWQKPHDGSVKLRSSYIPFSCRTYDKEIIDVINSFHAYCVACQYHIYTRSNFDDENSLFIPHVNSHAHRINLERLPKSSDVFETADGSDDGSSDDFTSGYEIYDSDDYDTEESGSDEWRCIPCDKVMPAITKTEARTLFDEIQIHTNSSQHEYNESIMNDSNDSLMVSIGLTPVLRYLTTESECKICAEKISEKHGIVHHIKTREHLDELESLLENKYGVSVDDLYDEHNQRELFRKLVMFQTESASSGTLKVPTTMYYFNLSRKEKDKVKRWVNFVKNDIWIKWQEPHPSSVEGSHPTCVPYFNDYQKDKIEVFNDFHAYCSACQLHIYARSDPDDDSSYFIGHVNSLAHRFNLRHFPKGDEIFEIYDDDNEGVCNVCEKVLTLNTKGGKKLLDEEIEDHIETAQHSRNALLMDDDDESRIVAIAMTPILKCLVEEPMCKICHVPVSTKFGNETHIKTSDHLANIGKLVDKYNFTIDLLFDVENLREFFARLVKDY